MNQPKPSTTVIFLLFPAKRKPGWRPVVWGLLISVILELATWALGITGDAGPLMAVVNGCLIWLSLSLLFWISEPISYYLFYRLLKVGFRTSLTASTALDALIVILSGVVMVNILHLTGTATPASWLWYVGLGMLHCVRAGQLRKNLR